MQRLSESAPSVALFDKSHAYDAARTLRTNRDTADPTILLAAETLARASDDAGRVTMTIDELGERAGFARFAMLRATQELTRSGLLLKLGARSSSYVWQTKRLAELAEETRQRDATSARDRSQAPPMCARVIWLDAYRTAKESSPRYGHCSPPQQPSAQKWPTLLDFGERFAPSSTPERVAQVTCGGFLRLDDPRLISEAHPLCFLPGLLDRLAPEVVRTLKRKTVPPGEERSADRQGFSGAQGLINRLRRESERRSA